MAKRKTAAANPPLAISGTTLVVGTDVLLRELRDLIYGAKERVTSSVNTLLVMLYWEIGHRVRTEVLKSARAA